MSSETTPAAPQAPAEPIPPLREGDRLTREEFERRYDAMPRLKKAELINGVVRMPSPVRYQRHALPHAHVVTWLGTYGAATPGVGCGAEASARLGGDSEPQADGVLFILPECGGQARISKDDCIELAPELMVEVAVSSKSIDLGEKKDLYCKTGAREYVVLRVEDREVDWFVLRDDHYDRLPPGPDGVHRSEALPGLWLDGPALARGDIARVLEVGRQGTASAEHAAFLQRLQAGRAPGRQG